MATRNYKLGLREKPTESSHYLDPIPLITFAEKFEENKIKNGIETYYMQEGLIYDIQNTSVICSRRPHFCVESKTRDGTKRGSWKLSDCLEDK